MTIEQLRRAHQRRPFQPFRLYIADGREISVPHPEFMYIPPKNERTFVVTDTHGIMETIDLLLVTSIKDLNGRARSRQ